jgi:hypothetical protein
MEDCSTFEHDFVATFLAALDLTGTPLNVEEMCKGQRGKKKCLKVKMIKDGDLWILCCNFNTSAVCSLYIPARMLLIV